MWAQLQVLSRKRREFKMVMFAYGSSDPCEPYGVIKPGGHTWHAGLANGEHA